MHRARAVRYIVRAHAFEAKLRCVVGQTPEDLIDAYDRPFSTCAKHTMTRRGEDEPIAKKIVIDAFNLERLRYAEQVFVDAPVLQRGRSAVIQAMFLSTIRRSEQHCPSLAFASRFVTQFTRCHSNHPARYGANTL